MTAVNEATEPLPESDEPVTLPASYAQQRVYFLSQLESRSAAAYNVPLSRRIRGPLDVPALERALSALIARHESLRTSFTVVDGIPQQVIAPPHPVRLPLIDLGTRPDPEAAALERVQLDAQQPFDLTQAPLMRMAVLRLAAEDHVLLLTLHHNIVDGLSAGILNRELGALYGSLTGGPPAVLPELPIQYGDYAAWQQELLATGGLEHQISHWRRKLEGAPVLLELPTDRPRPSRQSFRGAIVRKQLGPEVLQRAEALGERQGATLFMTLLAVYVALLSRYSGFEDIVVAAPIAGRSRPELEGVVGYFANTVALRVGVEGDPSFSELLRRVRDTCLDAFSNQDVPFEKLVEELNPERHLGHNPVAQVLFALQRGIEKRSSLPGLEDAPIRTDKTTAKFDVSLFAVPERGGLGLSLEYGTALFDEETARGMLEHYARLLEAAVADPARPVAELPMLGEAERRQLLVDWNATERPYPSACLHELVAEQVARTPDAVAVQHGEDTLTFAELDARANQLAHHLRSAGVGPDVLVAICVERSLEMVVGLLGILRAGGAHVPIDPHFPAERQQFMLANSEAPVIVTQERLVPTLPLDGVQVVCLDRDRELISEHPIEAPDGAGDPEQLAYVIYTSGSTGQPKGVQIPHRALVNFATTMAHRPGLDREDVIIALTTLSFDMAGFELYVPLITGARMVIADSAVAANPRALAGLLERSGATVLQATPTTWRMLLDDGWTPRPGLKGLCGGEAMPPALAERLLATGLELWNMYGPTETTVWSTCVRLEPGAPLTVGRPVANTSIYILDAKGQPAPVGVPGELWIGGHGLARGYRARADLTEERFVPDPFAGVDGARMYRTGDLARYRRDGEIEYLGRADHQVKVRGYRIEPGEIEAKLRAHAAVREALVITRDGAGGETSLVAYLLTSGTQVPTVADLRAHLQRSLPEYMIPAAYVTLREFPLTPNGKLDRRALPAPDEQALARSEYAAPTSELERSLAAIWQRLLTLDSVGADDDFFSLGGHSLLAVQLVHAVEQELDRVCTLPMLFRNPTIRSLAAELHAGGPDATSPSVLQLQPDGTGPALFCVCGVHLYQELADELAPDIPVYGIFLPVEHEVFGRASADVTVEQMAERYIELMREKQPAGPYLLLGLCFGGLLAYEIARQLEEAGDEVGLVVLLDTVLAGTYRMPHLRRALRRTKRRLVRAAHVMRSRTRERMPLPAMTARAAVAMLEQERRGVYGRAWRRYRVRPFNGATLLVRAADFAEQRGLRVGDETYGWGRYAPSLEIVDVDGDHQSHLRRPNVALLAQQLAPRLERARKAAAKGPSR